MIVLEGIQKVYGMGDTQVFALRHIDLKVAPGEMLAIMGPSGSGKSTMMNLIGCLDRPTAGRYLLAGEEIGRKNDNQLADVRNRKVGFIFQSFNLLPRLNAAQNVEVPLIYRGLTSRERRVRVREALERVGLQDRGHHLPSQLSGGQQQRVAIARAVASEPAILLGDEPTGALDTRTGQEVLGIFQDLHRAGSTVVLVTHDEHVALHCSRVVRLSDGRIMADERSAQPLAARAELERMITTGQIRNGILGGVAAS